MKKVFLLGVVFAGALTLGGCGHTRDERTVNGAAVGAASGAVIGGLASHSAGGAVAGALLGGAAGGIIGANSNPPPPRRRCAEWEEDYYGRRHCIGWYD
ncbi:hypothetical protein SAMN06265338_10191 [Rhodoblastus acidophilus]|uniref:Uncharacterized protein n=1 Tax=Rhodoblastus acidophilus TaxID=1074 RepID=A0A212PX07_RHOAC|nr:glycine zipper domain-containing protein [Rhodoblastus acidophilus]SNB51506.1 hypothetical protein SAMN06265338_10191 [Rhodoblastus acidophilus]